MSATYDPRLPTDTDWVRFQVRDTDVSTPFLQNEEIDVLLAQERNKYLAAANAAQLILARYRGVTDKSVDDLRLKLGDTEDDPYANHIKWLRERGAELQLNNKRVFRVL